MDLVFYGCIVPILVSVGLVGSVLTFLVIKKESPKSSTTYFLIALTLSDTTHLLVATLNCTLYIAKYVNPADVTNFRNRYLLPIRMVGSSLPTYISNWIVVMISIERFIAVLFPFKAKQVCTRKASLIAIAVAVLMPLLSTCPRWVHARGIPYWNNITNETWYRREFFFVPGLEKDFFDALRLVNTYMLAVTPVVIVTCANVCIIIGLYRNNRKFKTKMGGNKRRHDTRISRMLFILCSLFCFCVFPYSALSTYLVSADRSDESGTFANLIEFFMDIIFALLVVNSSFNFVIYTAASLSYRKAYRALLCACYDK